MVRIKIAIIGYGNVGKGVHDAIKKNSDMELIEIITRDPQRVRQEVKNIPVFGRDNFECLADVAILCGGSKEDLFGLRTNKRYGNEKSIVDDEKVMGQGPYFVQFFNTVDSFDTHSRIVDYHYYMGKFATLNKHTAIVSAGWDPGTFSLEKVLADAFVPDAKCYTFWGPGVSQGHSDAVRQIAGVKDARQYTLPIKSAIKKVRACKNPFLKVCDRHTRLVYVVTEKGADKKKIEKEIKGMPDYFADYSTRVIFTSEERLKKEHSAYPHGGVVMATRKKGFGQKALIEYRCEWGSNAEATGNILVASARACYRLNKEKKYGAYTMLDIPPASYSLSQQESLLKRFM